jgi:site-specific DNA recombinase
VVDRVSSKRFAFYKRLSTTDKQDPALSFPSQRKACEQKVRELGGEITREFTDQESGSHDDRPGWSALTQEARDREGRSFDAVVIYSTSRLARDVYLASMYHRELQAVGVPIHYASGGGDADTPEGKVLLVMQQAFDQYEREKLSRETKRGMREASQQGYRAGGRAPYGYRRRLHALDRDHQGDREKSRITLEPEPDEAKVVAEIFELFTAKKLSPRGIAEHLNQPGGPPPPRHVDSSRNVRRRWAASTIRAMLKNPVYTGRMVWNRRDFATGRQNGGGARLRARDEWVVSEEAHPRIVSDSMFEAAQQRFGATIRGKGSSHSKRAYVLTGMVRCCSGHAPLSMQGKARKDHRYYCCG